jgi:alkyl hydroperoxide reductase subunit AhpC
MNRWYQEFIGSDLVIIGVHTPEFNREKNLTNVREQTAKLGIKYPVVTDNEYKTWTSYDQQYWPMVYLIDKKGIIRYAHIGEGNYDETRRMIQSLLSEK